MKDWKPLKRALKPISIQDIEPCAETVTLDFRLSHWTEAKWGANGKCYYRAGKGTGKKPRFRRKPGMDFGTPMGNLIIPPWAQECAKRGK